MKLRTTTNSIRLRVRKSELQLLQKENKVEESIRFLDSTLFRFTLIIDEKAKEMTAHLIDNQLTVALPHKAAIAWIQTNEVGMEAKIDLPSQEQLHLLVEKDFPCLDRENEDKSDTFWELSGEKPDIC